MISSNEQVLKDVINNLVKRYKLEYGIVSTRIINSWESVAGELIAKHTENIYVRGDTLYIKLDSAALKDELSYAKEKLVKAINSAVEKEAIKTIVFM